MGLAFRYRLSILSIKLNNIDLYMKSLNSLYQQLLSAWRYLVAILFMALAIALLSPNGQKHKYQYHEGKPWNGELLMAPYDFQIYKDSKKLQQEQDSVVRAQLLVLEKNEEILNMVLTELDESLSHQDPEHSHIAIRNYLNAKLREVYDKGIVEPQTDEQVTKRGDTEVWLLMNSSNERIKTPLSDFYTLGDAYKYIVSSKPSDPKFDHLNDIDISSYLKANVHYSEEYTKMLQDEELRKISISSGEVKGGVRIVGKGEIVTHEIFNQIQSLERVQSERNTGSISFGWFMLGLFLVLLLWFFLLLLYLLVFKPEFLMHKHNAILLGVSILLFVSLSALNAKFDLFNPYIIPFVMVVMVLHAFFDAHVSLITYVGIILASAIFMPDPVSFVVIQMGAGLLALFSMTSLNSRAELVKVVLYVFLYYCIIVVAMELYTQGKLDEGTAMLALYLGINSVFLLFTYVLTFFIERVFGYTSYIALIELADVNAPLLRQLNEVASGTFQHSFNVSILASDATERIGGNTHLVRVAALYHDIGKMSNPAYFTENQAGPNLHEGLSYQESAQIIIKHVNDGIILAQKHRLPSEIIDFIRTHHGRGVTKYFYHSYCNEHPGEDVDMSLFQYPGPNPSSREQGVLMLADAVEASSRSLKEYTEQTLDALVNRIVDSIVAEGLLNETSLTLRDLSLIKEVFLAKLKTFYHSRIAYPTKA